MGGAVQVAVVGGCRFDLKLADGRGRGEGPAQDAITVGDRSARPVLLRRHPATRAQFLTDCGRANRLRTAAEFATSAAFTVALAR